MKYFATILLFTLLTFNCTAQISGCWQGLMIKEGESIDKGKIIYFDFTADGTFIGRSREEVVTKEAYALRKLTGTIEGNSVTCKQGQIAEKKDISGNRWCSVEFKMNYVDSSGYLTGTFKSMECKGNSGKVICYRSTEKMQTGATKLAYQAWTVFYKDDLKNNRKAPEIRAKDRKNFVFQPIYFDFDKTEIKPEYYNFLNSMVNVIDGHSDLRIKVIGYTDSKGSDIYNIDLSQRRAKAIIDYFVAQGLSKDRIQIDFKGENEPKGDNSTDEGRQQNRRVDFQFI